MRPKQINAEDIPSIVLTHAEVVKQLTRDGLQAGLLLFVSETGVGKTTMILRLEEISPAHKVFVISGVQADATRELEGFHVVTSEGTTIRTETEFIKQLKRAAEEGKEIILFIDEVTQMTTKEQAKLLKLISPEERERYYGISKDVPVSIVLAANPVSREYGTNPLIKALMGRISEIYVVVPSADSLYNYMKNLEKEGKTPAHPLVLSFLKTYSSEVDKYLKGEKEEGIEGTGLTLRVTNRQFIFLSYYLQNLERKKGVLTKKDVVDAVRSILGEGLAYHFGELYDMLYKTGAHAYLENIIFGNKNKIVNDFMNGVLINKAKNVATNLESVYYVVNGLEGLLYSNDSEVRMNGTVGLVALMTGVMESDNKLAQELIETQLVRYYVKFTEELPAEGYDQRAEELVSNMDELTEQYLKRKEVDDEAKKKLEDLKGEIFFVLAFASIAEKMGDNLPEGVNKLIERMNKLMEDSVKVETMRERAKQVRKRRP